MSFLYMDLAIAFSPIMGFTQHLAIALICCTTFTPSLHMVCIHFFQCPNLCAIGIMSESTKRAVADVLGFCLFRLHSIHPTLCLLYTSPSPRD